MSSQASDSDRSQQVDALIVAWLEAVERGESPDRDAWLRKYPELTAELQQFLDDHASFQQKTPDRMRSSSPLADPAKVDPVTGKTLLSPSVETLDHLPESTRCIRYFGDYDLLREIARGGMGVVYEARQRSLNRPVALKMILKGHLATADDVARFHREAEAAAQLEHPGIVPIFEIGTHDDQHYFTMGYVAGPSLSVKLLDRPLEPRDAATLIRDVAFAVQHAHDKGVIHRDLKPSNILLSPRTDGVTAELGYMPRVTDFGLAKLSRSDHSLTETGQILGTPSYMPPEQAAGQTQQIGPSADIYALGAVLYACLTGRPPFQAASAIDTMRQVLERNPVSLRELNSAIPRDLETICLKCLEKSILRRYPTAKSVADELQRYLDGRPIHARPVSRRERVTRWCHRNPVIAGMSAAIVFSLLIGIAGSSYFAWKESLRAESESEARSDEKKQRERAEEQTEIAETQTQVAKDALAEQERLTKSEAEQKRLAADRATDLQATLAQNFFERGIHEIDDGKTNNGLSNLTRAYATIPSESPMKAGYRRVLVDRCTYGGKMLVPPLRHAGQITETAFSSDRTWLVTACDDKTARIWNARTGLPIGRVMDHALPIEKIIFNSAETRIITISSAESGRLGFGSGGERGRDKIQGQRVARVWDAKTGAPVGVEIRFMYFAGKYNPPFNHRWKANATSDLDVDEGVWSFLHIANDAMLAVSIQDNIAQLWNLESGTQVGDPIVQSKMISSIGFSPDGSRLFTSDWAIQRDAGGGTQGPTLLLSLYGDSFLAEKKVVHVWDCKLGKFVGKPIELEARASIEFNDDMSLAAVVDRNTFRLWNIRDMTVHGLANTHADEIKKLMFSPDGTRIACAGELTVSLFDIQIGSPIGSGLTHDSDVGWMEFSPKGNQILTQSKKAVSLWNSATGQLIGRPINREISSFGTFSRLDKDRGVFQFNADGSRLAFPAGDHAVLVDTATGDLIANVVDDYKAIDRVFFSPDGSRLITKSKQIRIWDSETGRPLGKKREGGEQVPATHWFSPDGTVMLVFYHDGTSQLWDLSTATLLPEFETIGSKNKFDRFDSGGFEFSFDSSMLLLSQGTFCQVIEAKSADPLGRPYAHETRPSQARFMLGASAVATTCGNCVYLWDVNRGRPDGSQIPSGTTSGGRDLVNCSFSHNSRLVVTERRTIRQPKAAAFGDADIEPDGGTARLWDIHADKPIGEAMPHDTSISTVIFSPDDQYLLTVTRPNPTSNMSLTQWQLWDTRTGASIGRPIEAIGETPCFSRDGSLILVANSSQGSEPKTSRHWQFFDGRTAGIVGTAIPSIDEHPIGWISDLNRRDHYRLQFARPSDPERRLQFNRAGSQFVTVVNSHTVQVFDSRSGKSIGSQITHDLSSGFGFVSAVFSPGDDQIVSVSTVINKSSGETDSIVIQIWNSLSRERVGSEALIEGVIEQLQFSSDGSLLRILVSGDVVKLNTLTCEVIKRNNLLHDATSTQLALCPDGVHILGTNTANPKSIELFDDMSLIWRWESQSPGETISFNPRFGGIEFSPDGTRFTSQTSNERFSVLKFWDGLTGVALRGEVVNFGRRSIFTESRFGGRTRLGPPYQCKVSPDFKFALGLRQPDWEAFVWDTSVPETDHISDPSFFDAIALWTGFRADANGRATHVRDVEFNELRQRFQHDEHPFVFGRLAKSFNAGPPLSEEQQKRPTATNLWRSRTNAADIQPKESAREQRPATEQELARIEAASEVAAIEEAKLTSRRLINVDVSQGFDGSRVTGDVKIGKTPDGTVTVEVERLARPEDQLMPPGRLAQCFVIPDDVSELRFLLLTQPRYFQIALWHGNHRCHGVDQNSNFSTADRVCWDVKPLRGETVTLEIVIERSQLILPAFTLAKNPNPTLPALELSYVNRNHVIVTHRFSSNRFRKISSLVGIPQWIQWSELDQRMLVLVDKKLIRLDTNGLAEDQVLWESQQFLSSAQSDESESVLAVSGDEKRVAWLQKESPNSTNPPAYAHLLIQEVGETRVIDVGEGKNPVWTRDGKLFFEGSQTSSRLANWNGKSVLELPIPTSRTGSFPILSPDGKMIAFQTRANWIPANGQIALLDADGTNFRLVTSTGSRINRAPVFSPDNRYIAFLRRNETSRSSQSEEKSGADPFELVIFDIETDRETNVATDALGIRPTWRSAASDTEDLAESESPEKHGSERSSPALTTSVVDSSLGKNSRPDQPVTISEFELIYVKSTNFGQKIMSHHFADAVERVIPCERGIVRSMDWNEGRQDLLALVVGKDLPPKESILLRLSADGTGLEDTFWTFKSVPKSVSVSPDLQRLAWLDSTEGKSIPNVIVQELNSNPPRNLGPGYDPIWSADSQKLIYLTAADGWKIAIWDGKAVTELSPPTHSTGAVYPYPSPNGKLIAYGAKGRDGTRQIGLVSTEETQNELKIRQVTNNTRMNELPIFSPDGRYIAYLRSNLGRFQLAYIDLVTDRETVVADDVRTIRPVWRRISDPPNRK